MEFEYITYRTRDGNFHRPAIDVTFSYRTRRFVYRQALVDTGSDYVLLPLSIAEELGAEPDFDSVAEVNCACGNAVKTYESRYPLEIIVNKKGFKPRKWSTHVRFVQGDTVVLLGHRGFLDRFDATFFSGRRMLRLSEKGKTILPFLEQEPDFYSRDDLRRGA
jgi:hypothetical protein